MSSFRAKAQWTGWLLVTCVALAIAVYLATILLYPPVLKNIVSPFWIKGEGDLTMIIFIIFATVVLAALLLTLRRLNRIEDRVRAPWINQEHNGLYSLLHGAYDRIEKLEKKRKAKLSKRKGEKK
jgi:uncharacterized protein HemY